MTAILSFPCRTYDVSRYGAKGNGVADDGPAVRRARDALATAGGGTLFFPEGTYLFFDAESGTVSYGEYDGVTTVAALNIPSNCRVQGAGVGATTLKCGDTMPLGITLVRIGTNDTVPNNVEVCDMTIDFDADRTGGSPAGNADADIINVAGSSGTSATKIWLHHLHLLNAGSNTIDADGASELWITDNYIEGSAEGAIHIASYSSDNVFISRNYFYNNAWDTTVGHDSTGAAIAVQANDCTIISDNVFDSNYRAIILNTGSGCIISGNRIDAVDCKGGIWIESGSDKTSVTECLISNNVVSGGETCLLISGGRNIIVRDCLLKMTSGDTYSTSPAISVTEFDGLDISDVVVRYVSGGTPNAAIKIAGTTGTRPWAVRNCWITDSPYYGIQVASGVSVTGSLLNNKITAGQDGIRLEGGNTSFKLVGNELSATRAIYCTGSASNTLTVEDNNITSGSMTLNGSGHAVRHRGSGTPESAVIAGIGSVWHRTDGGAGTSMYVKESGTGDTGWVGK